MTFNSFRKGNFEVKLAETEKELEEVFKLQYEELLHCYNQEKTIASGMFVDEYDRVADHLIVIDLEEGKIAGSYRLVRKDHIKEIGKFSTESEFDISPLKEHEIMELSRALVRKEYRDGSVISLLWEGILSYVLAHGVRFLFGTASFHGVDPAPYRNALSTIHYDHLSPVEIRAKAVNHPVRLDQLPEDEVDRIQAKREMPPLVKGYINLGATFGEGGFQDFDFNSLDVFTLIDMGKLNDRYLKRFLKYFLPHF